MVDMDGIYDAVLTMTAREHAMKIIAGLDAARRSSSPQRPVDEVALIEAGIADAIAELEAQIAVRDDEIRGLQALYERAGRKGLQAEKRAKAQEMLARGLSYREIASRLGYKSPSFVHKLLNQRSS